MKIIKIHPDLEETIVRKGSERQANRLSKKDFDEAIKRISTILMFIDDWKDIYLFEQLDYKPNGHSGNDSFVHGSIRLSTKYDIRISVTFLDGECQIHQFTNITTNYNDN